MPIEIKELRIKAVVNTPALSATHQTTFTQAELDKWKKEVVMEAIDKVKEYLKEQKER